MAKGKQFVIRKYDGDDRYSWAVFYRTDLPRSHQGIVFYGQARPVISGCSRREAKSHADSLETKNR